MCIKIYELCVVDNERAVTAKCPICRSMVRIYCKNYNLVYTGLQDSKKKTSKY